MFICANMINAGDATRLIDPTWQSEAADGIALGITAFLTSSGS